MDFSIDKIRIRYRLRSVKDINAMFFFQRYLTKDLSDFGEKTITGGRPGSWRYSAWATKKGEESPTTFFIGLVKPNGATDYRYADLEFNPNKTAGQGVFSSFLATYYAKVVDIPKIDIAYDLKNTTPWGVLFDCHGATETMTFGTVSGDVTRYLRPKASSGRVKIYDKEKERAGKPDAEKFKGVTRLEISYRKVGFLLEKYFYGKDIDRLHEMMDQLNSCKVPAYCWHQPKMFKTVDENGRCVDSREDRPGLKDVPIKYDPKVTMVLDSFAELGRADKIQQYLRMMSRPTFNLYRDYIIGRAYETLEDNHLSFGFRLSEEISRVIPIGEISAY